jgi:transposase
LCVRNSGPNDAQKKTAHASEQEHANVKAARQAWFEAQPDLDPERLILIDESGLSTKIVRLRGWAPRGSRCRASVPRGHWKTTTFVAGLTLSGIRAPMLLDGPMDGEAFRAWCEENAGADPAPRRHRVMDNLPAHKVSGICEAIEAAGVTVLYLPPYSPDFNPIENGKSKLKAHTSLIATHSCIASESITHSHLNKFNGS